MNDSQFPDPQPIETGCTVRVVAYTLGARKEDCGRVGTVVAVNRTRAIVRFGHGLDDRAIGGSCLRVITGPTQGEQND